MSKSLRKLMVPIKKEPHWVLQKWDYIMAFVMCETNLDREVHTAADLSDAVQQGIGSYLQTPRNKGKGGSRAGRTPTKTTFTTESATEKGTSSQQQEGDKDSGDKDTGEDRNNQQGQGTSGNDSDNSGSGTSSDSGSSSTSSVKSILWPRNSHQRVQCGKSVEQEQ